MPVQAQGRPGRGRNRGANFLSADLAHTWLAWQCRMVAGIIRGALYLPLGDDQLDSALSHWPDVGEGQSQLHEAAAQALAENRRVIRPQQRYGPGDHRICDLIACPLLAGGKPVAVVSVMVSTRSEPQQHAILQLLQWGGLWLEVLINQQSQTEREVGAFTLALMTAILGYTTSHTAAMEVVNRLADRIGCERVSIGFRQGLSIRLKTLSHVASFDPRTQLVRRIEAAMEEAMDQNITLVHPSREDDISAVTRAHSELSEQQGHGAICTLPLPGRSGTIGVITLEREANHPFDDETVAWCESLARLVGPALDMKQREERPVWIKGVEILSGLATGVFGPSWLKLKLTLLAVTALLLSLAFIDGEYRVTAPASIQGAVRQLLVAPQDGYVREAEVRAGDMVDKGQLIATLDDRSLQLELRKQQSERNKIEKEYQEALAKRDRTGLSVLRAQLDQVDAQLQLVKGKIARTRLHAPFDGMVLSGDLSQSLGAPVEAGQVLFEVAPLDSYRVVLEVDEHDVEGLGRGKTGHLIIAALPQTYFEFTLDQLVPVAVSGEGRNFFRAEASLDEPSTILRPGMHGVAKVEMGQRKLLWILTHAVVDRLRLWVWSVGL